MASDESSFLDAIVADPKSDEPRLIYADWLEEQGDPRAELIRLQVRLAQLPEWDPRRVAWAERAEALLEQYGTEWAGALADDNRVSFARGFVEGIVVSADDFLARATDFFQQAPTLRSALIFDVAGRIDELMESPHLAQLEELDLSHNSLLDEHMRTIAASPHLRNLRSLNLDSNALGDRAIRCLAPARLPVLKNLSLQFNAIGAGGLRAIFSADDFSTLQSLALRSNRVRGSGMEILAEHPSAKSLTRLNVSANRLTESDVRPLIAAPLERLDALDLSENSLQIDGVAQLAEARWLGQLRQLNLRFNGIRHQGVRLLCGALHDCRIEHLSLAGNQIRDEGLLALAHSAAMRRIRYLDVGYNYIGDRGVEGLLESPQADKLESLVMTQNSLSEEVLARLTMECQLRDIMLVLRS